MLLGLLRRLNDVAKIWAIEDQRLRTPSPEITNKTKYLARFRFPSVECGYAPGTCHANDSQVVFEATGYKIATNSQTRFNACGGLVNLKLMARSASRF